MYVLLKLRTPFSFHKSENTSMVTDSVTLYMYKHFIILKKDSAWYLNLTVSYKALDIVKESSISIEHKVI